MFKNKNSKRKKRPAASTKVNSYAELSPSPEPGTLTSACSDPFHEALNQQWWVLSDASSWRTDRDPQVCPWTQSQERCTPEVGPHTPL